MTESTDAIELGRDLWVAAMLLHAAGNAHRRPAASTLRTLHAFASSLLSSAALMQWWRVLVDAVYVERNRESTRLMRDAALDRQALAMCVLIYGLPEIAVEAAA